MFYNLPATVTVHEDDDSSIELLPIQANCTYSTANYMCPRAGGQECPIITDYTEPCTLCTIASNPDPALFYFDGKQYSSISTSTVLALGVVPHV